ncbi:MAG TPA: thiamine phosphate synthase, partial [Casimicrobiaceae bacterium]|nr:thiamine phosphate synthase [Casimicrobiaceae bacterium]
MRGLYAVTPELADADALTAKVRAAIDGGARVVQYRDKSRAPSARRTQAQRLADLDDENAPLADCAAKLVDAG